MRYQFFGIEVIAARKSFIPNFWSRKVSNMKENTVEIISNVKAKTTYLVCDIDNEIMRYHSLIREESFWKIWEHPTYSYRYICPECGSTKVTKIEYPITVYKLIPEGINGKTN